MTSFQEGFNHATCFKGCHPLNETVTEVSQRDGNRLSRDVTTVRFVRTERTLALGGTATRLGGNAPVNQRHRQRARAKETREAKGFVGEEGPVQGIPLTSRPVSGTNNNKRAKTNKQIGQPPPPQRRRRRPDRSSHPQERTPWVGRQVAVGPNEFRLSVGRGTLLRAPLRAS